MERWIAATPAFAYVSFGSFLSVRGDVLRRVAEAMIEIGMPAAIATGSTPVSELGEIPEDWLVRDYLPQVRLLSAATIAVTHGGNNSVTEAIGQGVPLLVLPFSTDQFAGAAAIERTGRERRSTRMRHPSPTSSRRCAPFASSPVRPSCAGSRGSSSGCRAPRSPTSC